MREAAALLESMVQSTAWRLSSPLHSSPYHSASDSSPTSSASSSPSSSLSPPPQSFSPPSSSVSSTALPSVSSGPLLPIETFLSSSMSLLDDNGSTSIAEALPSDLLLHSAVTESDNMLAGDGEWEDDSYMFPPSSLLFPPSSSASTSATVSTTSPICTAPSLYTTLPGPWPSDPSHQTPVPCGTVSGGFLPGSLLEAVDVSSPSSFPSSFSFSSSSSSSSSSFVSLSVPTFSSSSPSTGSFLGGINAPSPYFTSSSSSSSSTSLLSTASSPPFCSSSSVRGEGVEGGAGSSLPLTVAAPDVDYLFDNRPTKELDDFQKAQRKQWKAYMRRERNKAAARKSNENKKILKEQLENKSIELKEENMQLHQEIQELKRKLRHLNHVQSSMRHVCCPTRRQRIHQLRAACQ